MEKRGEIAVEGFEEGVHLCHIVFRDRRRAGAGRGNEVKPAMMAVGAGCHHHPRAWAAYQHQQRLRHRATLAFGTGLLSKTAAQYGIV